MTNNLNLKTERWLYTVYNLYLNTSAGAVAASIFTSNNVEYIRYTVPNGISNQTYYITLVRIGAVNTQTPIGVAYYCH